MNLKYPLWYLIHLGGRLKNWSVSLQIEMKWDERWSYYFNNVHLIFINQHFIEAIRGEFKTIGRWKWGHWITWGDQVKVFLTISQCNIWFLMKFQIRKLYESFYLFTCNMLGVVQKYIVSWEVQGRLWRWKSPTSKIRKYHKGRKKEGKGCGESWGGSKVNRHEVHFGTRQKSGDPSLNPCNLVSTGKIKYLLMCDWCAEIGDDHHLRHVDGISRDSAAVTYEASVGQPLQELRCPKDQSSHPNHRGHLE